MTDDFDPDRPIGDEPFPEPEAGPVESRKDASRGGPYIPWGLTVSLLLVVLVAVFAVQNTQPVELRFLGWVWQIPLAYIIVGTLVVSVVLDEILGMVLRRRRRRRRSEKEELRRLRESG